jgi:L-fuconolactonase
VVFVEADCSGGDEIGWVSALDDPRIAGIVAHAPLERGPDVAALAAGERVVGVRRLLQGEPDGLFDALRPGVRALAAHGLTFDACVTHDQLPALVALAAACPDTTIVLDHLGKPAIGRLDPWREHLSALAAQPRAVCKLSGLTSEAGEGWSELELRPYLEHALDVFGPGRCLVGSDWPVASRTTSNERWLDLVIGLLAPGERADVLAATAERVYGLT